jgi:hypothetical protein
VPNSYLYEMTLDRRPGGALLGQGPIETPTTWRSFKMAQRAQFGNRVPVVSCWHHLRRGYRLNLTPTGQVYRSEMYWEFDPNVAPVVLTRMQRDLAGAPGLFGLRWRWNALAWYGLALAGRGSPETQHRFLALARRLSEEAETDVGEAEGSRWSAVGSMWWAGGDQKSAIAAYTRAMERPGEHRATPYLLLAALYDDMGREEQYRDLLHRMPAPDAVELSWMREVADALWYAGQRERAASWYGQISEARRRSSLSLARAFLCGALVLLVLVAAAIFGLIYWDARTSMRRTVRSQEADNSSSPGMIGFDL